MRTMLGWLTSVAAWPSRSTRRAYIALDASSGRSTLMATTRPSETCSARYTSPAPPPPPDLGPRPSAYVVDDAMPTMPLGLVRPARPSPDPPATATPKATEEFLLTRRATGTGATATRGRWALGLLLGLSMLVMLGLLAAWWSGV